MASVETRAADALRRLALDEATKDAIASDPVLHAGALRVARRYLGGETLGEALESVRRVHASGHAATVDFMGESARSEAVAAQATREFCRLAAALDEAGLPAGLSFGLSHVGLVLDEDLCFEHALRLAEATASIGVELMISMEGHDRVAAILRLHERLCERFDHVGVTLQARLERTAGDLASALERPGRIRLVKGAYDVTPALALERDDPALAERFLALARTLAASGHEAALATHDPALVAVLAAEVEAGGPVEFEMLLGLGGGLLDALAASGQRTREYVVYGTEWFLYVINRIAEQPDRVSQAIIDAIGDGNGALG